LIDDNFNPWLIEINSSPSMEHSTPVTSKLVEMVSEDIIKLIVDKFMNKKNKNKEVDVGGWKCIYSNGKTYI
jgi:tubulin monoglycylase TTLL3/8